MRHKIWVCHILLYPIWFVDHKSVSGSVSPEGSLFPQPAPPNIALLRALWSLLDGTWGILNSSWGVLESPSIQSLRALKDLNIQRICTCSLWVRQEKELVASACVSLACSGINV